MYALPEQTPEQAEADAMAVIALEAPHLSCYQLTLEPGTAFAAHPPAVPDEGTAPSTSRRRCTAGSMRRDPGATRSPPGHDRGMKCRHNLNYWTYGDYLALGAGAHGKCTSLDGRIERDQRIAAPRQYLVANDALAAHQEVRPAGRAGTWSR
ncbi:MAG: hypothetical protein U5L11_15465 [Arhodomonas sp.]|nr:hypothetical protein [Arhodomonas sp.]